jgi:hypothetical protein
VAPRSNGPWGGAGRHQQFCGVRRADAPPVGQWPAVRSGRFSSGTEALGCSLGQLYSLLLPKQWARRSSCKNLERVSTEASYIGGFIVGRIPCWPAEISKNSKEPP